MFFPLRVCFRGAELLQPDLSSCFCALLDCPLFVLLLVISVSGLLLEHSQQSRGQLHDTSAAIGLLELRTGS